jgi:ribonucleoside-diphosphate reductase alpha chain
VAAGATASEEVQEPASVAAVVNASNEAQQTIRYEQNAGSYDDKVAAMQCSLDNPDACEACGS